MSKSYKKNNNKNYAIFVKSGNSDNYVSQINIPIGNYILNEEKLYSFTKSKFGKILGIKKQNIRFLKRKKDTLV